MEYFSLVTVIVLIFLASCTGKQGNIAEESPPGQGDVFSISVPQVS